MHTVDGSSGSQRLQTIVDTVEDALYQTGPDGRIVAVNEAALELTGYAADDLLGAPPTKVLDGSDVERVEEVLDRIRHDDDGTGSIDVTILTADGPVPCELRVNVLEEDGEYAGSVGVARDISQRVAYERELEASRRTAVEELDAVMGRSSDAFYALDEDFRFRYLNDRAEELLGVDREAVLGETIWEVLPTAEDNNLVVERFEAAMEAGEARHYERYSEVIDTWVEATVYPSADGISVYFRDVSERKEYERELERLHDRMEFALEVTDSILWTWDVDADEATFFPDEEPMYGTTVEDWDDFREIIHPEDREQVQAAIEHSLETGEAKSEEVRYLRDGEVRWMEAPGKPITDDDGDTRLIGIARDVTDRREREHAIERSEQRYRTLADNFPDGAVALFDEDYRFTAAGGELFETAPADSGDEIIGDTIYDRYPPALAERIENHFAAALEGERHVFEEEYLGLHLRAYTLPVPGGDDGEVDTGMLVVQNITDLKELEAELRERERRYRDLFTSMSEGYCVVEHVEVDDEVRFVHREANPAFEDQTGLEDIVGRTLAELIPDRAAFWQDVFTEAIAADRSTRFERETEDGRVLQCYVFPVGTSKEDQAGLIITDITERVERERFLAEAKDQLEAATEAGAVATWEWDIQRDTFVAGPSFAKTFGIDPERAREGMSIDVVTDAIHGADRDRVMEAIDEAVETCGEYREEYRVLDAEDRLRWVVARGHVESDGDGEAVSFPGALTDVTERKEYEMELSARNRLHQTIRAICRSAVAADSRSTVETEVCHQLVDLEPYIGAWIADTDRRGTVATPSTYAWSAAIADTPTEPDPTSSSVESAAQEAVTSGEVQVVSNIQADGSGGTALVEVSLPTGVEAAASVPIVHEDIPYGVLTVFADRSDAFVGAEAEILTELGEILGLTMAALERKQALLDEDIIEVELRVGGVTASLGIDAVDAGPITFDRIIATDEGRFLLYGSAPAAALETLRLLETENDGIDLLNLPDSGDLDDGFTFQLRWAHAPLIEPIAEAGGRLQRLTLDADGCEIEVQFPSATDVSLVSDLLREAYDTVTPLAKRNVSRADDPTTLLESVLTDELTERQRAVLETAYAAGYFDWPREASGVDLAETFDISQSTASEHLRAAQRKLLATVFEDIVTN